MKVELEEYKNEIELLMGKGTPLSIANFQLNSYLYAMNFIKDNHKVIDFGCGSAYGINLIKNNISKQFKTKCYGLDIVERSCWKQINGITFLGADSSLEKYHNYFDIIINYQVVEHIISPVRLLHSLTLLMEDDGILLLSTPNKKVTLIGDHYDHYYEFTAKELKNFLLIFFHNVKIYYQYIRTDDYNEIKKDYKPFPRKIKQMKNRYKKFAKMLINYNKKNNFITSAENLELPYKINFFNTIDEYYQPKENDNTESSIPYVLYAIASGKRREIAYDFIKENYFRIAPLFRIFS